ncbi:two-component system sensor histidine kinase YesM [Clostridium saccharoperbutylacetonicum]|uniref:histidine kinase n=1 Tax=Clostridium saccharoperbutylacetonicum N1-4(HMT) TaxID=931276 RepID=M1M804_9CLOT|nr:histidine kinase [Clostridium saccharoperbutylacetonicum]AGF54089.1 sensor histidine kinase [Clostridium saccharoperbutylacetonicum N1-4(HMT)]NRT59398.1 two-component system sensor histidine kinase YesM [Clostridium saccharoperbutylacetonicum]NSB28589.1 two-component system sensor histidine kinase YesM [Clostridium saccharoperbutylacetonicum]NSB42081.1 two-component system sensor histidine kinase YesM [Clostridium saccharoperbutylacetonicum]
MKKNIRIIINNIKIKNKLIYTYLIVTIATALIVGTYLTTQMTNVIVNRAIENAENNSDTIRNRLEEVLNLTTKVSDLAYSDEKLISILKNRYQTYGEVINTYSNYPVLRNYLKYYRELSSITVYVDNDTILGNTEILRVSDKVRTEDWYKKAVSNSGKIAWRYTTDEFTGHEYLSLIRSIKDNNGALVGVLVININPSILNDLISTEPDNNMILLDGEVISLKNSYQIDKKQLLKYNTQSNEINVLKTKFNDKDSYLILNSFKIEKTLENNFKVVTVLPIAQITDQTNKVIINSIIAITATIILAIIMIIYFSKNISNRIDLLRREMHRVVNGDFYIMTKIDGNDEIGQLYDDLNIMVESINKLINEVYLGEIQKEQLKLRQKEAEFKMLANQINPHFLYNTLETIRMKAFCNGDKEIADIVKKLGKIMRRNLEVSGKEVTLKSELELIEGYLQIQSMRFEGMVSYEMNIEDNIDTESYKILPLLLQPVVENAFIHGLEEKRNKGTIIINIFIKEKLLIVKICDDGVGIKLERLQEINKKLDCFEENNGKSIGLMNVNQRIKMYYGGEYGMNIESEFGKGTIVTLFLPI